MSEAGVGSSGGVLNLWGSEGGGRSSDWLLLESDLKGSDLRLVSLDLSSEISDGVLVAEFGGSQLGLELLVSGLEGSDITSGVAGEGGDWGLSIDRDVVSELGEFLAGLGELDSEEFDGSGLVLELDVGAGLSDLNELVSQGIDGVLRLSQEGLESD